MQSVPSHAAEGQWLATTCTCPSKAELSGAVPCLQVYDLAFARGTDIFGSVGADGSVRMFDLRSLEHSTIM